MWLIPLFLITNQDIETNHSTKTTYLEGAELRYKPRQSIDVNIYYISNVVGIAKQLWRERCYFLFWDGT